MKTPLIDFANAATYAEAVGLTVAHPGQSIRPGEIHMADVANDSRFGQAYFNEPMTNYAVGGWNKTDLEAELQALCPELPAPRNFTYNSWVNSEAFLTDSDDSRAIGADFKRVEYTLTKATGKTVNRGLIIRLDMDEVALMPGWENMYTGMLLRRLKLNAIKRAYAIIDAASTNTGNAWSTPGNTIDPDADVRAGLKAAVDASGLRPNTVVYGQTAWDLRFAAYRTDGNAARYNASLMTPEQVAQTLAVSKVFSTETRYQSTATAKAEALGSKVLSFYQQPGASIEDPTNIKRFVTPTLSGGPVRAFRYQVSDKLIDIGIEHYELIVATYTGGVRKHTIT